MVGGLILSQALTLFTTPVVYLYLDEFSARLRGRRTKKVARAMALLTDPPPGGPPLGEHP
jgi:hypothetical protein